MYHRSRACLPLIYRHVTKMAFHAPAPQPQPRPRRRSLSRHRAQSDINVFDYRDPPDQQHYYPHHHHAAGGQFLLPQPIPTPAPAPPEEKPPAAAAAASGGGILKTLTDPLKQLLGRGTAEDPPPPPPPPPPHRNRNDPRRIHSYTAGDRQLILAPAPGDKAAAAAPNKLLSLLPSLPSLPSIPFLTPDPPPQLSHEALHTVVRYLDLYTRHGACQHHSPKRTKKLQVEAERLMLGMSPRAVRNLHEYLVGLKRAPDVKITIDPRMLERYTGGDREGMEVMAEGLGDVLVGLAGVLEGGFTVPGGWVEGE
ncbi:hypothetical protein K440DRAFT_102208 [Wilcoxina mikolae CBS 423.85]|nr:hypothetical protein K440DRAFT_102208 [Wilcoxina mikolae CBS 423.85]